jgi:hypothetical protein
MQNRPDGAFVNQSLTPLYGLNNSDGDWYFDSAMNLFSYLSMYNYFESSFVY